VSGVLLFPFKCPKCKGRTHHFPSDTPGDGKELYLCPPCDRMYEVYPGTGEVIVNERVQ
jgi:hypothetical protein